VEQLQQHTELTHVQQLVQQGTAMIRQRQAEDLDAWLQTCHASPSVELQNFVDVLQRDYAAVKAALTLPWSNGPVAYCTSSPAS
jgi:transposase